MTAPFLRSLAPSEEHLSRYLVYICYSARCGNASSSPKGSVHRGIVRAEKAKIKPLRIA